MFRKPGNFGYMYKSNASARLKSIIFGNEKIFKIPELFSDKVEFAGSPIEGGITPS